MKKIIILLSLFTAAAGISAQTAVWNMDSCMRYAVDHSIAVQSAIIRSSTNKADYESAVASFLPTIDGQVVGQYSWGRNIDPETNTYNTITTFNNYYQVYGQLLLFDGGQTIHRFKQAKMVRQQGMNAIRKAQEEKSIEVMQKYVDAVYYRECIKIATDKLADSRQLLVQSQRMEELGMKGRPDVAQIESQLAEDDYNLTHQQNQYRTALLALKSAMNFPTGDSLAVDSTCLKPVQRTLVENAETIYDNALGFNTTAADAEYAVDKARYDYKIEKGKLFPKISLTAGISTSYYKNLTDNSGIAAFHSQFSDNMGEYVYATLSIPIFDLSLFKNVKKARNNMRLSMINRDETLRKLHDDIEQAVMDCEGYGMEIIKMEEKVKADSLTCHLTQRKYEEGMVSAIDLHTSSNTLLQSRISLLQMHLLYVMKERLVDYYKGKNLINE